MKINKLLSAAALMVMLAINPAVAQETQERPAIVGLHIATKHDKTGFCEFNPGIYMETSKGVTLGVYKNSECNTSGYAGYTFETRPYGPVRLGLMLGGVIGYTAFPVAPMVIPSVSVDFSGNRNTGWGMRAAYLPKFGNMGSRAVHFSLEKRF